MNYHTVATLDVKPFRYLVFHDGYLGFSSQSERARNTLNWRGVLDSVNCTCKKFQVPISKIVGSKPAYVNVP